MVATVLLIGLLAVAAATDLRSQRIPNWVTYPGILAALALNGLGSAAAAAGWVDASSLEQWGWVGLGPSAAGFLACGAVVLVCYLFLRIGGGDVKMIAMIGAFLGFERGIVAMLWTFVLGGCLALIVLIWRLGPVALVSLGLRHLLWTLRLGHFAPLTDEERIALQPPLHLAPSALAAVLLVQFTPLGGLM
jgi:prepilin peptidase CpaA